MLEELVLAQARARIACERDPGPVVKSHYGHEGRPGQRGGSAPYGDAATGRVVPGVRYFGTLGAALAYAATTVPTDPQMIHADPTRGYYVAPMRATGWLERSGHMPMG